MSTAEAPVDLVWSMSASKTALHVDYTLTNRGPNSLYVFDSLVVRGEKNPQAYRAAPGRAVVMESAPGAVKIVLGAASAGNPMGWIVPPLVKPLAAGASTSGSLDLPLPLVPWHNLGWAPPFRAEPKTATLMVQVFLDEPEWKELPAEDAAAGVLKVPMSRESRTVIGNAEPIPQP